MFLKSLIDAFVSEISNSDEVELYNAAKLKYELVLQ